MRGHTRLFLGKSPPPLNAVRVRPIANGITHDFTAVGAATVWQALADDTDSTYAHKSGADVFTVKLQGVTDPVTNSGIVLKLRGLCGSVPANFELSLWDGDPDGSGTLITQNFLVSLTTSAADYTYTLTSLEAAAISEAAYNGNLYLQGISST
jgi:hypothetical protein